MSTVASPERKQLGVPELISNEVEQARAEVRPISRRSLALVLVAERGIPFREALDTVDVWCEEHSSATPCYIGSEFGIYWLKFLAVAFALVGLGVAWQGVRAVRASHIGWPWWVGATLFVGLAAFVWVQSIEKELRK